MMIERPFLYLVLFFGLLKLALAGNGEFGAPSFESFQALSQEERALYEKSFEHLHSPEYVNKSHYRRASIYTTEAGQTELKAIAAELVKTLNAYGRFVSIGRSGSGILAYLSAVASKTPGLQGIELGELPFSSNDRQRTLSPAHSAALRSHLEANGLSPERIAASAKPVLFFDFVYTATGATTLLEELYRWSAEKGIAEAVKAKTGFFGAYPAQLIVEGRIERLEHDLRREMGARFVPYSETEIREMAVRIEMPGQHNLRKVTGRLHSLQISNAFYNYAGTHVVNAQKSFTPEHWTRGVDRSSSLSFKGQSSQLPFVELYYVTQLGLKQAHEFIASVNCENLASRK